MNLRSVENYGVGLDIGTSSVGWSVIDEQGKLCHFKGRPTWGSRLFEEAIKAGDTRKKRGQRRRYIRRRWRLDLLQQFFVDEIADVDLEFFIRLRQSHLLPDDRQEDHRDYRWPLFNDQGFSDVEYYDKFPTIYHLREYLMTTDDKADIRLVYLALHNIVKHRGNFLRQGDAITSGDANMQGAVEHLCSALEVWCENHDMYCPFINRELLSQALEEKGVSRSIIKESVVDLLGFEKSEEKFAKAVAGGIVGLQTNVKDLLAVECDTKSISFSKEDELETFLESCEDDCLELLDALRMAYASFMLNGILSRCPGKSLSCNKVADYEQYGRELKELQRLVRCYAPHAYDRFFRGPYYADKSGYNPEKAAGYTLYNLGVQKLSYENFYKEVKHLFEGTAAPSDAAYTNMMVGFEQGSFLRRLKTSDNGSIPYQLHLEEMQAIIANQGKFYPFLQENQDKIVSLVTFRIPYYVGPLTQKNAACDAKEKNRFAWSTRKPGKELEKIYPWNWEDIIDKHASAEAFISRMTGLCTYLQGQPVLPKCSLLYEEYCVLNELNGAKFSQDGDKDRRFEAAERRGIIKDLFKKKKVSYKNIEDWMARQGNSSVHVSGGQGKTGFESKLSSYIFFCKDIFHVDELPASLVPMVEEIILWNTLFEDRTILKEKIQAAYKEVLDEEQIKAICKKRFRGWGRLSKQLLCEVTVKTDEGMKSIMDVLREGHPNNGQHSKAMVLMEALHDDNLAFQRAIDERNEKYVELAGGIDIDDLPGSPALRRGVRQALYIVDEIASIHGRPPAQIYIEVAREEGDKKWTRKRYDDLKKHLEVYKKDDPDLWSELANLQPKDLNERLTLYFTQRGRSLYSNTRLAFNKLAEYEVDHIIPQSYVKDDSLDNKALVLREENQRKTDSLLLDDAIRHRCAGYWQDLLRAELISKKKYDNLTRRIITDPAMKGFINRQLVETSQIIKFVGQVLADRYKTTKILSIKAGITSELRKRQGFAKCREANDYHHAHDAYLACQVGRFIQTRHPDIFDNPIVLTKVIRKFVQMQGKEMVRGKRLPGGSIYIVESFLRNGFNKETGEIFQDSWDADKEIEAIRASLNYASCFISRRPFEDAGQFWDETIYSPRTGKTLALPIKQGLQPQKYGSFSSEKFAYFFVYEAYDPKKKKKRFEFEKVPVRVAASVAAHPYGLISFAQRCAQLKGYEFVRIARRKIYKYQLIEICGERFYLTGFKEVRNANQLFFSQRQVEFLKKISKKEHVDSKSLDELFNSVVNKYDQYASRLTHLLKLDDRAALFYDLDNDAKGEVIARLVSLANAHTNMVDLRAIGGATYAGAIKVTFSNECSAGTIRFIDQSVTGMYERRFPLEF